jgi:sulfur carrier protein ThiS
MKITVKLYAHLGNFLPPGAKNNQAEIEVAEGATVAQVFARLNVPAEQCHLVLVNGAFVAPGAREGHALKDKDALAAWPPVAGG